MKNVTLFNPLKHKEEVVDLLQQLNPKMNIKLIEERLIKMVEMPNYRCFALFENNVLVGISSAWTTLRIYCGKQLEIDNVVIDAKIQSKGYGKYFIAAIKQWATENEYQSIGLNTYTENPKSHKFYFNQDFQIFGFHFEHELSKKC